MASLHELVKLVVGALISYLVLALVPEPFSKILLVVITGAVVAHLGWETYSAVVGGYKTLDREATQAQDFEGVEEAGRHFSQTLGPSVAQVLVMMATALVAAGAGGGPGAGQRLSRLLAKLPGARAVGARLGAARIPVMALASSARAATVTENGLLVEMEVAETAEAAAESAQAERLGKAVVGGVEALVTSSGHGPPPEDEEDDDGGLDASAEQHAAAELSFEALEKEATLSADRVAGNAGRLSKVVLSCTVGCRKSVGVESCLDDSSTSSSCAWCTAWSLRQRK